MAPHPARRLAVLALALACAAGAARAHRTAAGPDRAAPRPPAAPAAQDPTATATSSATPPGDETPSPTPTPTATSGTPSGPLPDLRIAWGHVSVYGPGEGGCVRPGWEWWTDGNVINDGDADAGPFVVRSSSGITWTVAGLTPGQQQALEKRRGMSTDLLADADDQVLERDETNNRYRIPIPTLPVTCTPTPEGGTPVPAAARLAVPFAWRP